MKKYILIQNDGEIESNSFELIGASTKRGETGKIGFFGSGLKYSIAYMMRKGIEFKVFSGEKELVFTTTPETLKDQTFDRICINGKPTSYTVTMGPTWTEDWFVLREIYCNALDETNCQLVKETENINPTPGKTRIYIERTEGLGSVVAKWDSYFSADREPMFKIEEVYTSFLSNEDIGHISTQAASVFQKSEGAIFRKGVRVAANKNFLYDYSFDHLTINEDRTAKNMNAMPYIFSSMLAKFPNDEFILNILRTGQDDEPSEEYDAMIHTRPSSPFSERWVEFSKDYLLVVKERSGKYTDEMMKSKKEVLYIPSYFARELKKHQPNVSMLGMGKSFGEVSMTDVEKTPKMEFLLKEVIASLKEMGYEVPYNISVASFDSETTLGQADLKEKQIYLSDRVFDMGRREIALTLIEETEHIYSQKEDETRAFQTHIFSQWLKSMENSNGLFL